MNSNKFSPPSKRNIRRSRLSRKAGLPPGTIMHVGAENTSDVKVSMVHYNKEKAEYLVFQGAESYSQFKEKEGIAWIQVNGIHNTAIIESLGKLFDLHPLILEDIPNTELRPRYEEFDNSIFFTLKNLEFVKESDDIRYEQISFVFGKNYVLSFQEKESGLFKPIVDRLLNGVSKARERGTDYLVYLLIDATIDNYFALAENVEDKIEELEDRVIVDSTGRSLLEIQKTRRDLVVLMKAIVPLREAIGKLFRRENPLIQEGTHIYLNSIYDHALHIIESIDTQRDILSGLMEIHLSNASNRMSSVMKVLTVISTIFIPITFFAGVYGMNFKFFPELGWRWGYAFFWVLCLASILAMIYYFKKKKWL